MEDSQAQEIKENKGEHDGQAGVVGQKAIVREVEKAQLNYKYEEKDEKMPTTVRAQHSKSGIQRDT